MHILKYLHNSEDMGKAPYTETDETSGIHQTTRHKKPLDHQKLLGRRPLCGALAVRTEFNTEPIWVHDRPRTEFRQWTATLVH